jgi:transcription termination factor Rho
MSNLTTGKPRTRKPKAAQPTAVAPESAAPARLELETLLTQPQTELIWLAHHQGVEQPETLSPPQLVAALAQAYSRQGQVLYGEGTLEVLPDGYGFLRRRRENYLNAGQDIYVSPAQIKRFGLRTGMTVAGPVRPPIGKELAFALLQVERAGDTAPEQVRSQLSFDQLTPLHPNQRLVLETDPTDLNMRVIDLVTPVGKGQRGLIVAPPRTGKTVLLQQMAKALLRNHPECYLFVLLIDERPEEVTEMRRGVAGPSAEVVSSTFDSSTEAHARVAALVLEKAKRLVEAGKDVVILLDSITRLARAHNAEAGDSGKTLTGGLTAGALDVPKKFFGAARNLEEGGSLTILATALVDTGSRMDQVIFEEFKGTGNMELHLDRKLVDRRVWPAININASGTRREELLVDAESLQRIWLLRKVLSDMSPIEAMERLTGQLAKSRTNAEFLRNLGGR